MQLPPKLTSALAVIALAVAPAAASAQPAGSVPKTPTPGLLIAASVAAMGAGIYVLAHHTKSN